MSASLFGFSMFAFIASITPGPTNVLALATGSRVGVRNTLPFVVGAAAAASTLLLITSTGLAQLIADYPLIRQSIAWGGTLWLTALAWKLFNAPGVSPDDSLQGQHAPGWRHGAGLQVVNPKTWLMALTVSSLFAAPAGESVSHSLILGLIFFVVTCPCLALWAWLGTGASRLLRTPQRQAKLNRALAVLLAVSVWSALLGSS